MLVVGHQKWHPACTESHCSNIPTFPQTPLVIRPKLRCLREKCASKQKPRMLIYQLTRLIVPTETGRAISLIPDTTSYYFHWWEQTLLACARELKRCFRMNKLELKSGFPLFDWQKIQDFPGPQWIIFQYLFGARECLNIKKKTAFTCNI